MELKSPAILKAHSRVFKEEEQCRSRHDHKDTDKNMPKHKGALSEECMRITLTGSVSSSTLAL